MVSIIIPVMNEEKNIENLLKDIQKLKGDKEIIVVDGKSTDNTFKIASKYARVILSERGRAVQMNIGATEASGNIFWFLHVDSKVEENSILLIEEAVDNGYIGGGFSLYFHDYNSFFMKYIEYTSNIRAKKFGVFYGDQGIFVTKSAFKKSGKYPQIALMEDIELSRKLKKQGKLVLMKTGIGTSARKFKKMGPLRAHLFMHKMRLLYVIGVSPEKLYQMYYKK